MAHKFKPVEALDATGWSDWIFPKPRKPYHMMCCDCGLVHDLEFQAATVERKRGGWVTIKEILDAATTAVIFRARRNDELSRKPAIDAEEMNSYGPHACPPDA